MMGMRGTHVCSVPNCGNRRNAEKGYRLHQFPRNDIDRYNQWVVAIGNVKIQSMRPEHVIKTHYVCSAHFSAEQFFRANRNRTNLRLDSIPNLKLPHQVSVEATVVPQEETLLETQKRFVKSITDTTETTVIHKQQEIIVRPPQLLVANLGASAKHPISSDKPIEGGLLAEYLMSPCPVELHHRKRAELSSNCNCQKLKDDISLIRRRFDLCKKELHQCKQQLQETRSTGGLLRILAGRLDSNLFAIVKAQLIQADKAAKNRSYTENESEIRQQ